MPSLSFVRSRVVPAGTAMLSRVKVEQLALFLIAVAASVKVQLALDSRAGCARADATRALRMASEGNMSNKMLAK